MLLIFVKYYKFWIVLNTRQQNEHNTMYENYTTFPLLCYSTTDHRPPAEGVAVGTGAIEKKKK